MSELHPKFKPTRTSVFFFGKALDEPVNISLCDGWRTRKLKPMITHLNAMLPVWVFGMLRPNGSKIFPQLICTNWKSSLSHSPCA